MGEGLNLTRRGFLGSMLALGAAPAVVRAESLMKLWVPPQEIVLAYTQEYDCFIRYKTLEQWERTRAIMALNMLNNTFQERHALR